MPDRPGSKATQSLTILFVQDQYNGNSMLAMSGKNCVAIASDTRLSTQLMTIDTNFQRIFKVNDLTLMGISGLATDCQTL
jgi:20S proteasome subunit beta 3